MAAAVSDSSRALYDIQASFLTDAAAEAFSHQMETSLARVQALGYGLNGEPGAPEHWAVDGLRGCRLIYSGVGEVLRTDAQKRKPCQEVFVEHLLDADVLELFGSGFTSAPSASRTVTGLRFGPYKPNRQDPQDLVIPEQVCGDIFHQNTWDRLGVSMKMRNIAKMTFVYMRPVAGWNEKLNTPEGTANALTYILGKVMTVLHPQGKFAFLIGIDIEGDLSKHSRIVQLIDVINTFSIYTLTIQGDMSLSEDQTKTSELSGLLAPKIAALPRV